MNTIQLISAYLSLTAVLFLATVVAGIINYNSENARTMRFKARIMRVFVDESGDMRVHVFLLIGIQCVGCVVSLSYFINTLLTT